MNGGKALVQVPPGLVRWHEVGVLLLLVLEDLVEVVLLAGTVH